MADGTLSRYFEKEKEKGTRQGGTLGYSSAPSGDMGGSAAGGTAPAPAPSGPKAPASTGGSGFVNFGQYFGANAPAVQATVAKNIDAASSTKAMRAPEGAPGLSTFGTVQFGKTPSASTMAQRQAAGPSAGAGYDRAIAQTQEQMAGVSPYTQPGSYGTGTAAPSAFDAMLGSGLQQREAKTRFGELEARLGEQQAAKSAFDRQQAAAQAQAKTAAEQKNKDDAYKAWVDRLSPWYKENKSEAELRQMFDEQMPAGSYTSRTKDEAYTSWVNTLSPWYRQNYTDEQLRQMFDEQVPPEQYTDKKAPGLVS